jgi:hypothetical protein
MSKSPGMADVMSSTSYEISVVVPFSSSFARAIISGDKSVPTTYSALETSFKALVNHPVP